MNGNKILIYDFGGQSAHLISRRVQQFGFDAKIVRPKFSPNGADAIILSGGALSVYGKNSPKLNNAVLKMNVPVLGICYGHQLIAHSGGGRVLPGEVGEYGPAKFHLKNNKLFAGIKSPFRVWMNHRDTVYKLPKEFRIIGQTENTKIAAFANDQKRIYAVQFHPEVSHTQYGDKIIKNFLKLVGKTKNYNRFDLNAIINEAKQTIGQEKAIIGLSGGVDSSVAAVIVSKALGKNLLAVYVDSGFMRSGETEEVKRIFGRFELNLKIIKAENLYFKALMGITDPEEKRMIIGKLFIEIFDREAKKIRAKFLVQGTIYSDRIESGLTMHSSVIKSHHNVGGLPKKMKLKVYEPLRDLYKDEVRVLASKLNLPKEISKREVFPGPGLAIRIVGEVSKEKVDIVRAATRIIQEELLKARLLDKIYMAFPVLLPIKSVGVSGDERTYKHPLVVRVVESKNIITANFAKIPFEILESISRRITNEIKQVNRVVYDITNKPPGTMEWE